MYCPNCGKSASGDQKFCRSCGLNLQRHTQLLAAEPSTDQLDKEWLRSRLTGAAIWVGVFLGLMFVLLIVQDVTQDMLYDLIGDRRAVSRAFNYAGSVLFAVSIIPLVYSGFRFLWHSAYGASVGQQASQPTALPTAASTTQLRTDRSEFAPSVTEHTTELLESTESQRSTPNATRQTE